jgi:hypothetical protein
MLEARAMLTTVLFAITAAAPVVADNIPGVTATEIKIGNINAYSGPASSYSVIAKLETAFFKMVNDQGESPVAKSTSSRSMMATVRRRPWNRYAG